MFKLEDGREHFYQWDSNRRVLVSDPTITEVHFCNKTDTCSLVVKTYTDDTYDGQVYAEVPNILLQTDYPIKVYAFCNDGYTKIEETFKVKPRSRPSDYIYTETEVLSYQSLDSRITEIEKNGGSNVNLDNYYTKTEVEYFCNQLQQNDQELYDAVQDDLKGYAKTSDIPDVSNFITDIPDEYITETELSNKGYLTEHQSLEGYATEQYVDDAIANIDIPEGGGGSSTSGVKVFYLPATKDEYSEELIADLWVLLQEWSAKVIANDKSAIPQNVVFYLKHNADMITWLIPERVDYIFNQYQGYGLCFKTIPFDQYTPGLDFRVYFNSDGTLQRVNIFNIDAPVSGSEWSRYGGNSVGGDIYNILEIFVKGTNNNTSDPVTSYMVLENALGNTTYTNFPFSDESGFWYFDGYNIMCTDSAYQIDYYAIKS